FGITRPEIIARRNLSTRNPKPAQIREWLTDHGYGEPDPDEMAKDPFGKFLLSAGIRPKVATAAEDTGKPTVDLAPSLAARFMQLKRNTIDIMLFRFGKSDTNKEDIWKRIKEGAGPSFIIQSTIFFTEVFAALLLAVLVAYFRGTYIDGLATFL